MGSISGQQSIVTWLVGAIALLSLFLLAPPWAMPFLIAAATSAIALEATRKLRRGQPRAINTGLIAAGMVLALASGLAWPFAPSLTIAFLSILALAIVVGRRGQLVQGRVPAGMLSRSIFTERAEEELSRGLRFGRPAALLVVTLDQENVVRREYGRRSAQKASSRIAEILVAQSRSYDMHTRLSQGRFAILLPETTGDEAVAMAVRISEEVSRLHFTLSHAEQAVALSVSIGLAVHPDQGHTINSLLSRAQQHPIQARASDTGEDVARSAAFHVPPSEPTAAATAHNSDRALPEWYQMAYIFATWAACVVVFVATFRPIAPEQWVVLLTLGLVTVVSRQMRLDLYGRGSVASHFVALLAAGLVIGPTAAMLLGVLSGLLLLPQESKHRKSIFDAASFALSAGGATIAYQFFATLLPADGWVHWPLLTNGLFLGGICYIINLLLLVGIVSCAEGVSTLAVWRERYAWFLPHTLTFGILAAFMAEANRALGPLGIFIFAVPTFMMHLVTKQYVDRTREHVLALREAHNRLAQANGELQNTVTALEQSYAATLSAFSGMLDARDSETEGHSQRVVTYALAIGRAMRLGEQDLAALEVGALLHDIGKVGVSDAILRKNGRLTAEEWAEMKRHPEIGHQLTSRIPFLDPASPVVRHHHERWDGNGYPDGLREEQIPLAARIFAVADSFDAMISDRPYRRGMPYADAIAELQRTAGSQFDPRVIATFLELIATPGWAETVKLTANKTEASTPHDQALTPA